MIYYNIIIYYIILCYIILYHIGLPEAAERAEHGLLAPAGAEEAGAEEGQKG